jgi:signal transduction histidine kinase
VVETNRKFRDTFGDSLGRACYEVYKHRTEECYPCPVRETFRDGRSRTREEVVASIEGDPINVLVQTSAIRDQKGEIVSVMEMSTDITELRELESKLTSLGLLIGSVSHGLKGLLNGLSGGMYLVNTGFKKEDRARVHKGWEIVERNVNRIRNMVSDILYYAKDREPNPEILDAGEVLTEIASLMQSRSVEQGVDLHLEVLSEPGSLEADDQAIRSMLINLIENSLDACRLDTRKSDHQVTLGVSGDDDSVRFEISDNGIGMDRETREKAFSLFFSSKGSEGTGLGLFVSNRIAKTHGGRIDLKSEIGIGTSFIVTLPRELPSIERDENGGESQ